MLFADADACVDAVLERVGPKIVLGLPLGLGKAAHFANALYRRVAADRALELQIFTALTLEPPRGSTLLERRFLEPLADRLYGDYAELEYAQALRSGTLPGNVDVSEFYFQPGAYLGNDEAQQGYISLNYRHVARTLIDRGVNVIAQIVAARGEGGRRRYSLGSNPDVTVDIMRWASEDRRPVLVGQVSSQMPFMPNDAEIPADSLDCVLDDARYDTALFRLPNRPLDQVSYAIAVHIASLIEDGGTLQIGIGSLADAVSHVVGLRHTANDTYCALLDGLVDTPRRALRASLPVCRAPFAEGLYANSEMFVEGLLHLADAGVLKRHVPPRYDDEPEEGIWLHGGFFLGSGYFYRRLRELPDAARRGICMTGIDFTNTLHTDRERLIRERRHARFINSAMMVTLSGAIVSDGLADGRVVSGVGGQHDFVEMAHELPDGRSVIALPATRTRGGRARSNIVFNYAHTTIPRHLRDVVVTEYGAADVRGLSDRDVAAALLAIADSRFQDRLLGQAKSAGKIEAGYRIPDAYRQNLPGRVTRALERGPGRHLPRYPFGTDFTDDEARIAAALEYLATLKDSRLALAKLLAADAVRPARKAFEPLLARMRLQRPGSLGERLHRRLLLAALERTQRSGT